MLNITHHCHKHIILREHFSLCLVFEAPKMFPSFSIIVSTAGLIITSFLKKKRWGWGGVPKRLYVIQIWVRGKRISAFQLCVRVQTTYMSKTERRGGKIGVQGGPENIFTWVFGKEIFIAIQVPVGPWWIMFFQENICTKTGKEAYLAYVPIRNQIVFQALYISHYMNYCLVQDFYEDYYYHL